MVNESDKMYYFLGVAMNKTTYRFYLRILLIIFVLVEVLLIIIYIEMTGYAPFTNPNNTNILHNMERFLC